MPTESLFRMSVMTNRNRSRPFSSMMLCRAASTSAWRDRTSFVSTALTWAITTFLPPIENSFASRLSSVSMLLSSREAPAFSMSSPYTSVFTPAISASSLAAATSSSVQVGDLNSRESETMADSISPATGLLISTPFSLYSFFRIVAVQPTGSAR
ncbi:hypothetical protein D3C71_1302270 [compost metagenome]